MTTVPPLFEATLESHNHIHLLIKILTSLSSTNAQGTGLNGASNLVNTSSAISKLNIVFTPREIYFQLLNDPRICFQLIKVKREFFNKFNIDLNGEHAADLSSVHPKFGKCYSLGVSRLDGVSVFSLLELTRIQIVLRYDESSESMILVFLAKYSTGLVKKLVIKDLVMMETNYTNLYDLIDHIPKLDATELNYFDLDISNFEFIEKINYSSLRQYDFEIGTNGKIVRLRAFQPVLENDVSKQVSTHAISFRVRNLKKAQLIAGISGNKQEREYFKWQVKLSNLKINVLNFIKMLKCDFRVHFSEELNELLCSFNYLGLVDFNTVLIGFNDQFNNVLPIDSGNVTVRQANQLNQHQEEELGEGQQYEDNDNVYGDDFGYTPAPTTPHNVTLPAFAPAEHVPLFHQTQSNEDDPTDEGSDEDIQAPEQKQMQKQPQPHHHNQQFNQDDHDDNEPIVQWNETRNHKAKDRQANQNPDHQAGHRTLTNEEIINNAKAKYLKEQEKKRKLAEEQRLKEKSKRSRRATDQEDAETDILGPTQVTNVVKGLFD
ncbi:hypothetical protein WICPIJ_005680 [Wickerhamomyces pijperi]|uniref:Uncharacterized protein n=1 Tax=Wickerhamomyces pijperi TaxID=599730 RepID=A0A9P8Q345_WICPI|nr:hypothetical protein WICPIJ_005680 [Wickerhamomyces pijperi]